MRITPVLGLAITVPLEGALLHSGPAQEGVVANKGRDVAPGDGQHDGVVDGAREEGHRVLKVVVRHLPGQRAEISITPSWRHQQCAHQRNDVVYWTDSSDCMSDRPGSRSLIKKVLRGGITVAIFTMHRKMSEGLPVGAW